MTDQRGKLLHSLDEAAAEMAGREREMERLDRLASDIAGTVMRWAPHNPNRAAALVLETVFDDRDESDREALWIVGDAPAWRYLKSAVDFELNPTDTVREMLKASVESMEHD